MVSPTKYKTDNFDPGKRNSKAKIGESMNDLFNIDAGSRQGDALSATLFDIALHEAVKNTIKTGSIGNKSWQICAYVSAPNNSKK